MANNLFRVYRWYPEINVAVNWAASKRKTKRNRLARVLHASQRGQNRVSSLGIGTIAPVSFILWRVVLPFHTSRPLAQQTQALQRLLEGDIDSRFRRRLASDELDTISV